MALTAAQVQALIIAQVGDIDPATMHPPVFTPPAASPGIIATNMAVLWERWASLDVVAPGLRELVVKRGAIELVIATLRDRAVDIGQPGTGLVVKEWERVQTLQEQLKEVNAQIKTLMQASTGRAKGASEVLPNQWPIPAPVIPEPVAPGGPDANDTRYTGSPYRNGDFWSDV